MIDDHRHLAVRVYSQELGPVLLALAGVDRLQFIREARLFQEECDLHGVGSQPVVEGDQGTSPRT